MHGHRFPVFLTLCHMCACAFLAYLASIIKIFELQQVQSKRQLGKIFLLATVFCASLVLGNASLRFLPVSFTQVRGWSSVHAGSSKQLAASVLVSPNMHLR